MSLFLSTKYDFAFNYFLLLFSFSFKFCGCFSIIILLYSILSGPGMEKVISKHQNVNNVLNMQEIKNKNEKDKDTI